MVFFFFFYSFLIKPFNNISLEQIIFSDLLCLYYIIFEFFHFTRAWLFTWKVFISIDTNINLKKNKYSYYKFNYYKSKLLS